MKNLLKALLGLIGLGFIMVVAAASIYSFGWNRELAPNFSADAVIILGCRLYGETPSPFLQERLKEGLRLYQAGYGKYIIVSGGQGPGEDISEAEAMKRYLVAQGVEESKIIMEDQSTSTMANLIYSRTKMEQYGLKDAIIVSNKYHLKRASLMAGQLGITAQYSGVFVEKYKTHEMAGFARETIALLKYYVFRN